MKDIKLDPTTWDIAKENRDEVIISGVDCLVQRLKIKLQHISGEWYLDTSKGVINQGILSKKNPPIGIITGMYRTAIETDPEITRVVSIDTSFDSQTRSLFCAFEAESI